MKRAKKHRPPSLKPRNPVARSPLLGKGGPHERSPSAKRQREKRELARQLRDETRDG
jgi:hypothetical protein